MVRNGRISPARDVIDSVPNHGGHFADPPRFLVFHYTAGTDLEGTIRSFSDPARRASAHLVVGRDGEIVQCVPLNHIAWHAGQSSWTVPGQGGRRGQTYTGLNEYSIGIEIVNAGWLLEQGGKFYTWCGQKIGGSEVVTVDPAAPASFGRKSWQAYTPETTMSYLTQMLALTVQNFVSAATGMALDEAKLWKIARRNRTLVRAINVRRGLRRKWCKTQAVV